MHPLRPIHCYIVVMIATIVSSTWSSGNLSAKTNANLSPEPINNDRIDKNESRISTTNSTENNKLTRLDLISDVRTEENEETHSTKLVPQEMGNAIEESAGLIDWDYIMKLIESINFNENAVEEVKLNDKPIESLTIDEPSPIHNGNETEKFIPTGEWRIISKTGTKKNVEDTLEMEISSISIMAEEAKEVSDSNDADDECPFGIQGGPSTPPLADVLETQRGSFGSSSEPTITNDDSGSLNFSTGGSSDYESIRSYLPTDSGDSNYEEEENDIELQYYSEEEEGSINDLTIEERDDMPPSAKLNREIAIVLEELRKTVQKLEDKENFFNSIKQAIFLIDRICSLLEMRIIFQSFQSMPPLPPTPPVESQLMPQNYSNHLSPSSGPSAAADAVNLIEANKGKETDEGNEGNCLFEGGDFISQN
jgi:hypothetical protein